MKIGEIGITKLDGSSLKNASLGKQKLPSNIAIAAGICKILLAVMITLLLVALVEQKVARTRAGKKGREAREKEKKGDCCCCCCGSNSSSPLYRPKREREKKNSIRLYTRQGEVQQASGKKQWRKKVFIDKVRQSFFCLLQVCKSVLKLLDSSLEPKDVQ